MSELKPCPFCGGEAELDTSGDGNFSMIYDGYASVRCCSCDIETPWFETKAMIGIDDCNSESDRVIQSAIDFWNNRPHENKIKAEVVCDAMDNLVIYNVEFEGEESCFYKRSDFELYLRDISNDSYQDDKSNRLLMSKAIREAVDHTNKGDDFGRFSCLVDDLLSYADKLKLGEL